ncbi:MAG: efflux RND transporter periplasmic adaptor subunit [Chiayiivirga sp.]|jgi:cobalt-zinc-cadmium efflux system membrane fusion protein|uniref:efflux RND transporter periplasmic adaptor subunit n=1 Tax=Chiayiivirga sp. TaxID=2041042 RepID=UPI0025C73CCE|nr:efflux RND transporter periplasmic adaptor subunit [Chiayiivirga sp.]MCI1710962.1 efflux RND transporter periplasmic adaptor subunit [Chiayiivirga sp.]MCI1728225.1 efflux RND transporter periplasmic adaptor subunit [Chiayiivirga sp.]
MMLRLFRTAALMIGLALLAACSDKETATPASTPAAEAGHEEGGDHDEHGEGEEGAAPIRMDEAALKAAGIVIAPVVASALSEELRAPGEVVDSAYGTTLITPRVDAIVVRRHAKLGDEVTQGTPLVTLSSVEVAQAQGTLRIAEQDWKRVQELGRDAVSGRRYTESQVAVEQARAAAQAYGIAGASAGKANGEFTLSAPHAGRITEDAFVVGERIEPGRTLFRLVDESVVWVDATMPAENANRIAVGSQAQIVLGETRMTGTVLQRAHRTSEGTRNALVRVEVPNDGDRLHGGDYVEVYLDAGDGHAAAVPAGLAVPTAALVQLEGETVVFRQAADGTLAPVAVRAGDVIGDRTLVLEGLTAGDRVVVEGAYALKAQILKSQLGEGHAH